MNTMLMYEVGKKIGNCTYIGEAGFDYQKYQRHRLAKFICPYCGNEFVAKVYAIKNLTTRSCGCLMIKTNKERETTHGRSNTSEWIAWRGMKKRCYNVNFKHYINYGARGIKVCDEWLNSFETFFSDMGKKPSSKHSLDRIDNDGSYCKSNCRWSTRKEQDRNKRCTVYVTYQGVKKTLMEWVEQTGVNRGKVRARLLLGWKVDKAFDYKITS